MQKREPLIHFKLRPLSLPPQHGKTTKQKLKYYRHVPKLESVASVFKADAASRRTSSYFSPR